MHIKVIFKGIIASILVLDSHFKTHSQARYNAEIYHSVFQTAIQLSTIYNFVMYIRRNYSAGGKTDLVIIFKVPINISVAFL